MSRPDLNTEEGRAAYRRELAGLVLVLAGIVVIGAWR